MSIDAGKYEAKVKDYGFTETKAGDPQVVVDFVFSDKSGATQELAWYGSLKSPKGREITLKALVTMGLKTNDIELLAGGVRSGVLNTESPVQIDVAYEVDQNGTRSKYPRIKWVNPIRSNSYAAKLGKDVVKVKLGGMNLKAELLAMRGEPDFDFDL